MTRRCIVLLLASVATLMLACYLSISNVPRGGTLGEYSYIHMNPIQDRELRREPLRNHRNDDFYETSAFVGFPGAYKELVDAYIQDAFFSIDVAPLTRQRFYHEYVKSPEDNGDRYPDVCSPVRDQDVIVPLAILPRPEAVRRWSSSARANSWGWRTDVDVQSSRGSVYGRTLVFKSGELSSEPEHAKPVPPMGSFGVTLWDYFHEDSFSLELGKLVDSPLYIHYRPTDRTANLHLGEVDGAVLKGEFVTVPAFLKNTRLRWTSIKNGSSVRRFLAYALVDGNGVRRIPAPIHLQNTALGPVSVLMRPLICERHQPKINQHDELLLPTPLGWAPIVNESSFDIATAHEEWCLDDWFPAQKDACWVIREAEDSKPLQESFLLMPALEPSERPVFFVSVFAETEPKQLVRELAALHKVSPDKVLNSPETMARLQSLYERVRDFPLAD